MTPAKANPWFINVLNHPWGGVEECDADDPLIQPFLALDPDDEGQMRAMIRQLIVPYFRRVNPEGQQRIRQALAYCLSLPADKFPFYRFLQSAIPPFRMPCDPRVYYLWCWEECFPGELYQVNTAEWEYAPNCNEVNDVIRMLPENRVP